MPVTASTTLLHMVQQAMRLGERADLEYRLSGDVFLAGLTRRTVPYERSGRLQLLPETGGGGTRITSYNVCYTKLLRQPWQPHSSTKSLPHGTRNGSL